MATRSASKKKAPRKSVKKRPPRAVAAPKARKASKAAPSRKPARRSVTKATTRPVTRKVPKPVRAPMPGDATSSGASGGTSGGASGGIGTYASALRWLFDHTDYERMRIIRYNTSTFSLDRMRKLLKLMGNPQEQLKTAHVAGTKGKGSTCAMLDAMLRACGYTVGSYSSPHLTDLRERIAVNGQPISQSEFTELVKFIAPRVTKMGSDRPTFFEIMTAMAFQYFVDQAVDIAILETGLGGRLDATNVVTPCVTGITQISFDHIDVLGKTLPDIAREKAGIFKKGVPAVSCEQTPAVVVALKEVAEKIGTPLQFTGTDIEFSFRFEANRELGPHTRVCLTTPNLHYEHLAVPLQGEHQALNCGLALAMLDKLRNAGFTCAENKIVEGLAATTLPGRMELAWPEPRILLDGAHNAASMQALIKSIGAHIPYDSLVMIFGCGLDKDIPGMLREVNLGADKVIFTRAKSNPRAKDPKELQHDFMDYSDKMAQTADNLEAALQLAARAVSREDLIVVTGSFYLVGEAKKYLADLADKRAKDAAKN
ncbi:MAG: cyanophycin synthetase [Phycisphaeraceae bacterium]